MDDSNLLNTILALISILVSILVYLISRGNILLSGTAVVFSLIFISALIISPIFNKIKIHSKELKELEEKLKRAEQLIDIKADIEYLKRRVK